MEDVKVRADVEKVIDVFYEKLLVDANIKHIFEHLDLPHHLPVVVNFWENMLFQTGNYHGGMMWVHLNLNERTPLTTEAFERWLALFFLSIDQNFAGDNAEFMKKKALEIGQIMHAKIQHITTQKV